jgi:hypothetical protein
MGNWRYTLLLVEIFIYPEDRGWVAAKVGLDVLKSSLCNSDENRTRLPARPAHSLVSTANKLRRLFNLRISGLKWVKTDCRRERKTSHLYDGGAGKLFYGPHGQFYHQFINTCKENYLNFLERNY